MLDKGSRQILAFSYFEVDLEAGEIRRAGLRVRLTGQPFRLLAMLLARPGEIVGREEIQREIWGASTNVDFDRGIASVANKLREALGDAADHPLYIETLARKGYRFIAPVTVVPVLAPSAGLSGMPDEPAPAVSQGTDDLSPKPAVVPQVAVAPQPLALAVPQAPVAGLQRSGLWLATLALIGLLAVTCLGLAVLLVRRPATSPVRVQQLTRGNLLYPGPPNPELFLTLVTDGPRLYAPVLHEGQPQLASMRPDGSDLQALPLPEGMRSAAVLNISEDGSTLLLREAETRAAEQPLWLVPTTGRGAQRVGDVLGHDATWLPGARNEVLVASGNRLEVVSLLSGEVRPYLELPGRAFWLRWSPDGRTLRLTLLDPDQHATSLWEVDAATRHLRPLALAGVNAETTCCGNWVANGAQYVFEATNGPFRNIWSLPRGHFAQPQQLTNGPVAFSSPLPSLDGQSVYVFGGRDESLVQYVDERSRRLLPVAPFLQGVVRLAYSPDGSRVAWTDANQRLWCARADGTDLLQLTTGDLQVFSVSWSPDAGTLLLMARVPGQAWGIYTLSSRGGSLHTLLKAEHNLADPSWSPDARQMVYGREADLMGQDAGPHTIEMLDMATGKSHPLPGSEGLFSPRWSPDGAFIAALSLDQSRLLVFSLQTQSWRVLFTGGGADPVWAKDSRSIFLQAIAQPLAQIVDVDLSGHVRLVGEDQGGARMLSTFLSGITPDGAPVIKSQSGSGDLYRIALR